VPIIREVVALGAFGATARPDGTMQRHIGESSATTEPGCRPVV